MRPEPRYLGVAIALVSAIVYAFSAPAWVVGGDNGEFATLYANGGVAHPPGYPLYVMLLRLFAWLPVRSAAHGAAIVTAVLGGGAVLALHQACRAWRASEGGAAVAAAAFASSSLAWRQNSEAEVFGLNVIVACAIVVAAAPTAAVRGWRRSAQLGLLAGLGLSNHHSIVLLAPLGLWAFARTVGDEEHKWRSFVAGALALVVGLAPYAYLYWCAKHADASVAWVWGDVHDLPSLVEHFRRAEYGTMRLARNDAPLEPGAQLWHLCARLTTDLLGLPVLALVLAIVTIRRARADAVALAAAILLCGPGFVSILNIAPHGLAALVVERFYLLPAALVCVPGALALDRFAHWVLSRRGLATALAGMILVVGFLLALPRIQEDHRPTVEMYAKNTLRFAPANAVILASGDQQFAGFLYAQRVLHLRPDVAVVAPRMLTASWYRERMSRALGITFEPKPSDRGLVEQLVAIGRPVAFAGPVPRTLTDAGFVSFPLGTLQVVQLPNTSSPTLDDLEIANVKLLEQFELEPVASATKASWAASTFGEYARTWLVLATRFEARGSPQRAQACRQRALAFAPWLAR